MARLSLLPLVLFAGPASARYSGTPAELSYTPPTPRCAAPHSYTWYATVQHCMWINENHSLGNNCPLLNDTLFELVYYAGNVVNNKSNLTQSVSQVASALELLPEGFRIVQAQNCHNINTNPADNILKGTGCKAGTHFSGVWWDAGIKQLAEDNTAFLTAYKQADGPPIDAIVLDPELSLEAWALFLNVCSDPKNLACCYDMLDSIQDDPRFPPLLADMEKLGFKVDKSKPHWLYSALIPYGDTGPLGGYTENLAIWEGYSNTLTHKYYNQAVLEPAQKIYPKIDVNNYGDMTTDTKHCLPDQSGYTPCRYAGGVNPTVTGTQQAPCMYVWMENASVAEGLWRVNQTAQGTPFDFTGWNGLLYGINLMRENVLSSTVPVVPWVAYKNDTNMSPFMWAKPMANTDYYQEHILHLAMHNPPSMLYFNPCWAVGYCDVSWEDNLLYANLFHELTEMAGCTFASRKWVTAEFAGWDDEVVASGLALPDGTTVPAPRNDNVNRQNF